MEYKYLSELSRLNVNEITSYRWLEEILKDMISELVEDINSNSASVNDLVELMEIIKNNK